MILQVGGGEPTIFVILDPFGGFMIEVAYFSNELVKNHQLENLGTS